MFNDIVKLLEDVPAEDLELLFEVIQALLVEGDRARNVRRALLAAAAKRAFRKH